jgi:PHD/YefM family antitoxin component YafN of YafNO toxin-antitoxin module
MKKLIFILAVTTSLLAGGIFTSCQSNDQKVEAAKDKVQDARQDLIEAQTEANDAEVAKINEKDWKTFKIETNNNIKNNELRLAELRVQLEKPGKVFDPIYKNKIEMLEQKNLDMKNRFIAYENSQNDWEVFKAEFNQDMEELQKSLREFSFHSKN